MNRGLSFAMLAPRAAGIVLALGLSIAAIAPAFAHHAWNEIDTVQSFQLSGRVKLLKWENPHASLVLEVSDGERKGEWTVLMSGLARMEARGVGADVVAVGKTLTLMVSPSRSDAHVVRANRIASGITSGLTSETTSGSASDAKEYVLY